METEAKRVKVKRQCPRCRQHAYHWGNVHGIMHRIGCANCGHEWKGRIRKDEMP
jgi:ribosomal protein L37E